MEQVTIYVDILLFVNLIVNGAIIFASSKITGVKTSFRRLAAADIAASAYGFAVCVPSFGFMLGIFFKTLFACAVSAVAFNAKTLRHFLKNTCIFLFCTFFYIAVLLAVQQLPFCSGAVYSCNSEIYLNLPVPVLLLSALFLLFAAGIISRVFQKRVPESGFCDCEVFFGGASVNLCCFKDTGNLLRDVITGDPVIIAERKTLEPLTGREIETNESFKTRLRIIPYKSAGGVSGVLTAFRPDKTLVGGTEIKALIALNDGTLGENYNAVIGTNISV